MFTKSTFVLILFSLVAVFVVLRRFCSIARVMEAQLERGRGNNYCYSVVAFLRPLIRPTHFPIIPQFTAAQH